MATKPQDKLAGELDAIRAKVTATKAALADLDRQPIAPQDVEHRVDQVVQHLAERMDTSWLGRALASADYQPGSTEDILAEAVIGGRHPGPILTLLFPDLLRDRLVNLIAEHADGSIPLAQRPAERQRLEQDLFDAEVDEERLVIACEQAGLDVLRRVDCDPSVVLATFEV